MDDSTRGGRNARSFVKDRSVTAHKLAPGTVRRILTFARPYKKQLAVFLGLILADALLGAAQPLLFKLIIDEGVLQGDRGLVIGLALAVAGLAVVTAAVGLTQRYVSARIGQGLVHDLRSQVFAHVQRMPIAFFSRTQTGALVSRLNGDVQGAQQAFTSTLSTVVGNIATTAAVLAAMFVLSWQITVAALVLVPLFVLPAKLVGRRLADLTRERYELTADMGQTMTERFNVAGALLVKIFGRPEAESAEFDERAARVRDIGVTTAVYSRVLMTSLGLLAALATAFVYGLGGVLAIAGSLGVGTVVALTAYLGRLYGPITSLSNLQVDIMTTLVSFERVLEVLDLEPMVRDAPDATPLPADAAEVEFDHVDFGYPAASDVSLASLESVAGLPNTPGGQVLHDVTFTARPGEMVALVGPSGAGKSTLTHLVSRLYDVTGGAVRVGGHDVRDVTQQSLRDAIGVVTQDAHLFHTTLRANLGYARPGATDDEIWAALEAAQIAPLVRSLPDGLDTVVGERGYRLSGGEKQRLAIARLLLKAPRIVVLDEATAHLDSESEAAVQRALETALAGRTSLVIAHRLSTVRDADQILVVDDGRIVERGTHDELLAAGGAYADLYRTQFRSQETPAPAAA
ncbi:ABC transporter ATP-binding protein [Jiangella rhizosphaerae]|uniref:Fatty acid ABC transporter ATP-binding/permease protein n=1 Tax=Jiangella rhizosphaerae TaxID=2293569 RepID=A0A418KNL7_9ACTN|nr:ABC transporter ATP-binding protein [Jiangella rhizosphaerae]RIQ20611.1 ABC transporter ATP-binding protein [Jiangella rhizosphaerae]